jgi:hypothetical protein
MGEVYRTIRDERCGHAGTHETTYNTRCMVRAHMTWHACIHIYYTSFITYNIHTYMQNADRTAPSTAIIFHKYRYVFQWPRIQIEPFLLSDALYIYINRTEIKPGKRSSTRIKPFPLANGHGSYCTYYISHGHSSSTPGVFCTYFYNHAHRLRLETLLYLELSRSSNGFFKPLLDPGGGFNSETAERRFQKWNGQKFNGYIFNGHPSTDASVRSGVTVM